MLCFLLLKSYQLYPASHLNVVFHKSFLVILCQWRSLNKKCPYSELFWSVFSLVRTEYGEILCISLYSVRMRENTDQNNSKYGHFLRNGFHSYFVYFRSKTVFFIHSDFLTLSSEHLCFHCALNFSVPRVFVNI